MSIMVKNLYKNGRFLYKMNLIAGRKGLDNLVQWVHIIEDDDVASFLHGNELVFTAGVLNHDGDWLLNFAHKLNEAGTSAFVVNIGPHTKEIPAKVTEYCNEVNMPLFTIPWETKMVDMTRDFCHRIMNNEHVESNTASTLKNIIFNVGDVDAQILQMKRYGYQRDGKFCFVSIMMNNKAGVSLNDPKDKLVRVAERIAKSMHELFIKFTYKEYLILVLVNFTDEEIGLFVSQLIRLSPQEAKAQDMRMGISANQMGIVNQKTNFEKALSAMEMAKTRKEPCCYYDKLGIYKVLYAVGDKIVLRDFCKDMLGKLESYDRENDTQLALMLQTYLDNNGSMQAVSEKQFVHRNTVTNQLKKIEDITGHNPFDLKDKVKLCLAFYIKDVLYNSDVQLHNEL